MARASKQQQGEDKAATRLRLDKWFAAADAGVIGVADWDIKRDLFCDVLQAMLADGLGVWFGMTRSGAAISITLVDGEFKQRVYVGDSVEWDDFWLARLEAMRVIRGAPGEAQNRISRLQEAAD